MCCSSQEEHVLKLNRKNGTDRTRSCSSQEEHVLKRKSQKKVLNSSCCSSQEEHVLKPDVDSTGAPVTSLLLARGACIETTLFIASFVLHSSCSSQEEHVLKHRQGCFHIQRRKLLLARGACIETACRKDPYGQPKVAPRKRSMY